MLITGGARSIGRAIGAAFANWGAGELLADRDAGGLPPEPAAIGARPLVADVSSTENVQQAMDSVISNTGRIDVSVNSAGILRDAVVWKMSNEEWGQNWPLISVEATSLHTQSCLTFRPVGRGRIVSITSYCGLRGNAGRANCAAVDAWIVGFTKTTAKELVRFGITVNAISANATTRMVESIPPHKIAEPSTALPLGRFDTPSEMAPAVVLSTDDAAYVTGGVPPIDGGISI